MDAVSFSLMRHAEPAIDSNRSVIHHLRKSGIFRDYQRAFEISTGQSLALRQVGSFQPPLHGSRRMNPFCELMIRRSRSCAACLRFQQQLDTGAMSGPKTLECFAGLIESELPLRVRDQLVGYVQTGQVFLQPPTRKRFAEAMQAGVPATDREEREFEIAYFRTPVVTKEQYESRLGLLVIFVQHLAVLSHELLVREAMAELPAITKIRAFITEHQAEPLHLRDAARAVNVSPFYFCKLFKRATGVSFTSYLARVRVETAKQMLLNADTRVSEAAYATGFQSLSQFNRVFRQIVGESPTRFRAQL